MIAPSRAIERTAAAAESGEEERAVELPSTNAFWGGHGHGHRRRGRFLYAVTQTETKKEYEYTTTTSITFKCTPAISVLPECE